MANYQTLTTLTASVRRRMSIVNTNTISDAEIQEFLNDSLAALYDMLASVWRSWRMQRTLITLERGREIYPLPPEFRAIRGLWLLSNNSLGEDDSGTEAPVRIKKLRQFNLEELSLGGNLASKAVYGQPDMYRVESSDLYITPLPDKTGVDLELWYVQVYQRPDDPFVSISANLPNGWELWVLYDTCCAVALRSKQMEFYQLFDRERERAEKRVMKGAKIRDESSPTMFNQFERRRTSFIRGL